MTGCAETGATVWYSKSDNPKRKYPHTWELVDSGHGIVSVNTGRANSLVGEALEAGVIGELRPETIRAEAAIPEGDGRFDFHLRCGARDVYVEVKSVTLLQNGTLGSFPDAVSARATKHLKALMQRVAAGDRAVLVFCAQHCGIEAVTPAADIDATYAATLKEASAAGVEILAYGCRTDLEEFVIDRKLPVMLQG